MDDDDTEFDQNEFILNHVVLPRYLPPEKQGYAKQLKLMKTFIENVFAVPIVPARTVALFKQFKRIHLDGTADNLKSALSREIRSLLPGHSFAMFVRRQNCTLTIHKKSDGDGVILATFRGDMLSSEVYSHESDIVVICQQKLLSNPIEYCHFILEFFCHSINIRPMRSK